MSTQRAIAKMEAEVIKQTGHAVDVLYERMSTRRPMTREASMIVCQPTRDGLVIAMHYAVMRRLVAYWLA